MGMVGTLNTPTIRPYRPADQPGIEWLYSRTPPWGRTYPRPEPVPEDLQRIEEAFEYAVVAVEQDRAGEAVVGLVTVANVGRDEDVALPEFVRPPEPTARLRHVLVAPERWRQGVGRRLVEDAVAWARRRGYRSVVLDTTAEQAGAVAFYHALGFREAGRTTFWEWEIVWFEQYL